MESMSFQRCYSEESTAEETRACASAWNHHMYRTKLQGWDDRTVYRHGDGDVADGADVDDVVVGDGVAAAYAAAAAVADDGFVAVAHPAGSHSGRPSGKTGWLDRPAHKYSHRVGHRRSELASECLWASDRMSALRHLLPPSSVNPMRHSEGRSWQCSIGHFHSRIARTAKTLYARLGHLYAR